jgi:hypothetical protein
MIEEGPELYMLRIDDVEILELEKSPKSLSLLEEIKDRLDRSLKLELEPYEVKVVDIDGVPSLCVGPEKILGQPDLPAKGPSLEKMRDSILMALERARQKHTFTNFVR